MHRGFLVGGWFGSNPKNIHIFVKILFFLSLGMYMSNTGGELLYYHSYHEEASFYLGIFPRPFNRTFIIIFSKLTISYMLILE